MPVKKEDRYANLAAMTVTQTVLNTDVYGSFNFPFSIMDKIGLIISRIEYQPTALNQLDADQDSILCAITVANNVADPHDVTDPRLVDYVSFIKRMDAAPTSSFLEQIPVVKDFSTLPGGGLLVAPNPMYLLVHTGGAAAVMGCRVRFWYTWFTMAPDEYWELVESRRVVAG